MASSKIPIGLLFISNNVIGKVDRVVGGWAGWDSGRVGRVRQWEGGKSGTGERWAKWNR